MNKQGLFPRESRRPPVQANQFVVYNDYFEDAENHTQREKENRHKEPNRVPDMPRKEKVLHGRRANPQDVEEPYSAFSRPDSSRLASADSRPSVTSIPQPSFHRGRRNNWQLKQDESEKLPDTRSSLRSPTKAGLSLKDAYRRELSEQGKILQARKVSNSQNSGEPRKWHDTSHGAALKPCNNNLQEQHDNNLTPLYSVIGEEERLKIQSLCPPSLAQKMNFKQTTHRCHQDLKPLKPQPMGRLATKQILKHPSKEPPPSYPFWTEAKELSSSHHRQERNPVDYRRSRACC